MAWQFWSRTWRQKVIETKTATNVARGHRQNVRLGSSRSRKLYSQSRVASSAADHKLPKNTTVSKKRAWSVTSPAEWQLPAKPFLFFFFVKRFLELDLQEQTLHAQKSSIWRGGALSGWRAVPLKQSFRVNWKSCLVQKKAPSSILCQ